MMDMLDYHSSFPVAALSTKAVVPEEDDEEPLSEPRALFPDVLSSEDPLRSIPLQKDLSHPSCDTASITTRNATLTEKHGLVARATELLPTENDETVWTKRKMRWKPPRPEENAERAAMIAHELRFREEK
jgi:hypothetical protein